MNKNSSNRSAAPRNASPMLIGILIGMVLGVAIAGGVAWYILKSPGPFVNKEQRDTVKLMPDAAKPPPTKAGDTVIPTDDIKPRFEFYKVLTDKPDALPVPKADVKADSKSAPKAANEPHFLQAGAFSNEDDADKVKAKLAMLGVEANIQPATLPDKTLWYRVRLGPYKSQDEINQAVALLKQNGFNATPMHGQ